MKNLVIIGSTGSVGTQTLDVVRSFPDDFRVVGLIAGKNFELLEQQVVEFKPKWIYSNCTQKQKLKLYSYGCFEKPIEEIVALPSVDLIVTATSGDIALVPTLIAINNKKNIALANKESIVIAGKELVSKAKQNKVDIFPLDSEPNAIWQCLKGEEKASSKLINSRIGEVFLKRLSKIIHPNKIKNKDLSVNAIRSGIILSSYNNNQKINLIDFFKAYPNKNIAIDLNALSRTLKKVESLKELVEFYSDSPFKKLKDGRSKT